MSDRPIEELQAGWAFRETMIPRADGMDGHAPLWHGWVIMDAFLAGIDYAKPNRESEMSERELDESDESDYVMVPREPTKEMVEAGGDCPQMQTITGIMSLHQARGFKIDGLGGTYDTCALAEAYRAMIAAAPQPPALLNRVLALIAEEERRVESPEAVGALFNLRNAVQAMMEECSP